MENNQGNGKTPMRETQVREQLEFLNNAIRDNDSIVRELIQRLDMVIEQQEEKPDSNKPEVRQKLVAHAEEIRSFGERIICLTIEVRATLDHLEL
jgi:ferritin-like metal-binding protein YciE